MINGFVVPGDEMTGVPVEYEGHGVRAVLHTGHGRQAVVLSQRGTDADYAVWRLSASGTARVWWFGSSDGTAWREFQQEVKELTEPF